MLRRIAVMVNISTGADPLVGLLRVSDVTESQSLALAPISFVLTLEVEGAESFAQGQIRPVDDSASYAIRAPRALFDRLERYVGRDEATE
jgi:hypothetical protein